jgi:hypothetical protein
MVKTTNTVSTTNTLYAEIDGSNQRYVLLQHDFHVSRASYSNEVFTINRSVTGTGFDTNTSNSSIILWTNVLSGDANGTNIVHGTYLLDMAGYARARITQYQLLSTNVLDVLTNDGLFYQVKWDR